jgi:hypothetical protein
MPERQFDNNAPWTYELTKPSANFMVHPLAVQADDLVEAVGLDGRFVGALRTHPGFGDETLHGIPRPETGVTTIESITNIVFAKYVSIQKGTSGDTFKGIVYLADNQNADGQAIYFACRDSSGASDLPNGSDTDVVMLEDLADWTDFSIDQTLGAGQVDFTSMGRYIYFSASGDTTSTYATFQNKELPYNKAYFWDFKLNEWDKFTGTFDGRFMGLLPRRCLGTNLNEDNSSSIVYGTDATTTASNKVIQLDSGADLSSASAGDAVHLRGVTGGGLSWGSSHTIDAGGVNDGADQITVTPAPDVTDTSVSWTITTTNSSADSDNAMDTEVYSPTTGLPEGGVYTYAAELVSRKHNLRSYMRYRAKELSVAGSLRWTLNRINLPIDQGANAQQIKGNAHTNTCVIHWGIPHVDGFRLWRTVLDDTGRDTGKYEPVASFYMVNDWVEKGTYITGSTTLTLQVGHSQTNDGAKDLDSTFYSDGGLPSQTKYDPFIDDFGPAPRLKRVHAYDGLLLGVSDVEEPTNLTDDWDVTEQIPEQIVWSSIVADEPENFPANNAHRKRTDDAAEKFLSFETAGDHCFAVSNMGIYRVSRSGSQIGINKLQFRLGGISRFGQTGIGNSLFLVTTAGLKEVDGNTGAIRSVRKLDRYLTDNNYWAGTLDSVFLEYDATIGALILLNTEKEEAIFMWESTGAVTTLENVPWVFLTGGPDVLTAGPQRAYFISSTGQVHAVDGAREMGKQTMCASGALETVNGTVTAGTNATTIIDSAADAGSLTGFPANCVNFEVHILSGDYAGESGTISARDSATQLTISALSGSPAVGDRYSIAPVVVRATLPQLISQGNQTDSFVRKITHSMSVALSDLSGEVTTSDPNGKMTLGMKQILTTLGSSEIDMNLVPDKMVAALNFHSTRIFPYFETKGSNMDYQVQSALIKGQLSISEAQSRQGTA